MRMKRLWILTVILLTVLCAGMEAGSAEYDPVQEAGNCLTEVFGYTQEEAAGFVFEDNGIDTVRFWPEEHPDWVYTLNYDSYGALNGTTPFSGEKNGGYPGEGAVNTALRTAREQHWFARWDEESRAGFQALITEMGLRYSTALLDALQAPQADGADALQAFLCACYGPEYCWTRALIARRDEILAENGLTLPEEMAPEPGVKTWRYRDFNGLEITRTAFYREAPEELRPLFSQPRLAGWQCLCGALWQNGGKYTGTPLKSYGNGLAAFEKDGRRLLLILNENDGAWSALPAGENALYAEYDFIILPENSDFHIIYRISDTERAAFRVNLVYRNGQSAFCQITEYQRIKKDGDAFRITIPTYETAWTASLYQDGGLSRTLTKNIEYLPYLGAMDIAGFPTDMEGISAEREPVIPEGYGVTDGVHLRARTSSRSKGLGTFLPGAVIPLLETLPGDPNPWYRTALGKLNGYVSSVYVHDGSGFSRALPTVARSKAAVSLKKGTGLLDGSAASLPAGTDMHVVLEDGSWYYVCVPQGELGWFMDVNGVFGYVKKRDVITAGMACQLDWAE